MEWISALAEVVIGGVERIGISAIVLLILAVTAAAHYVRSKPAVSPKNPKTAMHQEVTRPETQSEIRSAAALEAIAETLGRMDRTLEIIQRTKPPS